jgi:diguanylate cyclase (GGDEF)-like protein
VNYLAKLEKQNRTFLALLGFIIIGVIGIIDLLTGYELAFSVFYVLPISLVTWLTSQRFGILASLTSAIVWLSADMATGHPYSHPLIPVWNSLIRFAFFVIITLLLSALKKAIQRESELARTDYLTGAVNLRYFYELAQMEIDRLQRYGHPFTLAYIDLDEFKAINDQFGHASGDRVLYTVASSIKKNMRKTDICARLGGDEFALLLPETDQEFARLAISKIQGELLKEMQQNN